MKANRDYLLSSKVYAVLILGGIALLLFFAFVPTFQATDCGPKPQTLSNMKQLHLATQQMALDATVEKIPHRGWPGDMNASFTNWIDHLVPTYLSTNEITRLLSISGNRLPQDVLPRKNTNPILVYAVREDSPGDTVILSTANFINTPQGGYIDPSVQSFTDKFFLVFRKNGTGAILKTRDAGRTNKVGSYAPLCH